MISDASLTVFAPFFEPTTFIDSMEEAAFRIVAMATRHRSSLKPIPLQSTASTQGFFTSEQR